MMIVDEPRTKVPREPRREVQKRPTWMSLDDGITKIECFVLALVPQHPKRQSCEVVWRRGRTYGVKFLP